MNGTVTKVIQHTHDVKSIFLKTEKKIDFIPGQFMMVGSVINGKLIKRAYSLCNAPSDEILEICVRIVDGGALSPVLFSINENDEVNLEGPYGNFKLDPQLKEAVLIGAGTGIAPLICMLRHSKNHGWKTHFTLVYAIRNPGSILYEKELYQLAKSENVKFYPVIQDTSIDWNGLKGRISQDMLVKIIANKHQIYYLCGPPVMIKSVEEILRMMGVEKPFVKTDKWD